MLLYFLLKFSVLLSLYSCKYTEKFRPQVHFSTQKGWMNDPNGLVYYDGEYHLYYQSNKESLTFGGTWWAHAVSRDLIHWQELPTAFSPDEDGNPFSGSAIVDADNSTGFQRGAEKAIVAILTRDKNRERESQHIWYSNDKGRTFERYEKNPVLEDTNFPVDFRDPKIRKFGDDFVVAIAAGQEIRFYKSKNMKAWEFMSSFGQNPQQGTHGGVWECPDLVPMTVNCEKVWVLIVNLNPGGPIVGSGTQYFVGKFNGSHFINDNPPDKVMWLDYGPDNYAGITYENSPGPDPIFVGWASNWDYGNLTDQNPWRGQMTLPRTLKLEKIGTEQRLKSYPVENTKMLINKTIDDFRGETSSYSLVHDVKQYVTSFEFDLSQKPEKVEVILKNAQNESFSVVWFSNNTIVVDRSQSGQILNPSFGKKIIGNRISRDSKMTIDIIYDSPVIEIFFDKGLTSFTVLHFPNSTLCQLEAYSTQGVVRKMNTKQLNSIWN